MIKNLEAALAPLNILSQKAIEAKMRGELTVANRIAEEARAAAPGSLSSKIEVIQSETDTTIIGGDHIAAYVEFGTGTSNVEALIASVPGNFKETVSEEAIKFFVNGKGSLNAKPFFFPAIFVHEPELIPEIEKELQKIV